MPILLGVLGTALAARRSPLALSVHHRTDRERENPCAPFAGVGTFFSGGEPGGGPHPWLRYGTSGMGCIWWDSSGFPVRPSGRRTRFVLDLLLTKQVDIYDIPPMRSGALIV